MGGTDGEGLQAVRLLMLGSPSESTPLTRSIYSQARRG